MKIHHIVHLVQRSSSEQHFLCCFRLDHYLPVDLPADSPLLPFCTRTFSLDFSMHTFEHLHVSGWVLLYCVTVTIVAVN